MTYILTAKLSNNYTEISSQIADTVKVLADLAHCEFVRI